MPGGVFTVRQLLISLHALQKIDADALEYDRAAQVVLSKVAAVEAELEPLRTELGAANTELATLRREQAELESHLGDEDQKHRKWKSRLNEIKSPREYQALSRELEQGERQVRDGLERIEAIGAQIEEKQKAVDARAAQLQAREADVSGQVRELRQSHVNLLQQAQAARAGRDEAKGKIPERVLKKYDQLRANRNGTAVALIVDGTCSGCNVRLRPQHVIEIRRYESLEQCSSCQRLLVPDELVRPRDDAQAS
jgi:predicted  nucleic acid-binding Zn-ribbon protein